MTSQVGQNAVQGRAGDRHRPLWKRARLRWLVFLAVPILTAAPVPAALVITFDASDEVVLAPAPATVSLSASGFTGVFGFSFSLQWDPSVVQFSSLDNLAALPGFTSGDFNTSQTGSGRLGVLWDDDDLSGESLANGSKLFDVNFTTVGSDGTSTTIAFGNTPTARDASVIEQGNPTQATFAGVDGSIAVVPEPANAGLFATVLLAGMALLRFAGRRKTVSG